MKVQNQKALEQAHIVDEACRHNSYDAKSLGRKNWVEWILISNDVCIFVVHVYYSVSACMYDFYFTNVGQTA